MRIQILTVACCLSLLGCDREPLTPREQAEHAQQKLEDAREEAAEIIAESEEEAVDMVADARQDAKLEIQDARAEAGKLIEEAETNLNQKLNQLGNTETLIAPAVDQPKENEGVKPTVPAPRSDVPTGS